jgi:hypothetical protein
MPSPSNSGRRSAPGRRPPRVLRVLDQDDARGRWCLAHLYWQAATSDSLGFTSPARWEVGRFFGAYRDKDGRVWDRLVFNEKWFKARPGNREVYAALSFDEVHWDFKLRGGWVLVAGGVCEGNWHAAVGERPARFFGNATPPAGRK